MLKNKLNLKGAQKLSKSELRNFTGGGIGGGGPLCPTFCFYDEQIGFFCGTGYQCVPFSCGAPQPGYRCEQETLPHPHH